MHRLRLAAVTAAAALTLLAPGASAAPDRTASLTRGETPTSSVSWTSAPNSGANTSWFLDGLATTGECGKDLDSYCDNTLIKLDVTKISPSTTLTFRIQDFNQATDIDLRVYESDRNGAAIRYLGAPVGDASKGSPLGTSDPRNTFSGDAETKELKNEDIVAGGYYLVQAVHFTAAQATYKGIVTATNLPAPDPLP